jgi:hypothetical protein
VPDQGQLLTFGVAFCLVVAAIVGLRHGLDLVVRFDAKVPHVNPNQAPDAAELIGFEKILERRGSRGMRLAVFVGVVVCISVAALIRSETPPGTPDHERIAGDDVAIMYGLIAGFVFYIVRLVLCRCPRCGRRLIGLWTLLWLAGHLRGGGVIKRQESLSVTRCPHCDTPFSWMPDGRPAQIARRKFSSLWKR